MESKLLKTYKGMIIEKSYEINMNGSMDMDTVVYCAFTKDGGLFDAKKYLSELKKEIDRYMWG